MPLVVPSERVAVQARELGFLRVHNAGGAGDEMMLAALEKSIRAATEQADYLFMNLGCTAG